MAKNMTPEQVMVDIQDKQLHVTTKDEAGKQDYELKVEFFGKVSATLARLHADGCMYLVWAPKRTLQGHCVIMTAG